MPQNTAYWRQTTQLPKLQSSGNPASLQIPALFLYPIAGPTDDGWTDDERRKTEKMKLDVCLNSSKSGIFIFVDVRLSAFGNVRNL